MLLLSYLLFNFLLDLHPRFPSQTGKSTKKLVWISSHFSWKGKSNPILSFLHSVKYNWKIIFAAYLFIEKDGFDFMQTFTFYSNLFSLTFSFCLSGELLLMKHLTSSWNSTLAMVVDVLAPKLIFLLILRWEELRKPKWILSYLFVYF